MSLKESLKIMIVDDMAVSRGLLTQSLEEIGLKQIDHDKSGESALPRLAANPVHLVISDFNMPGMNGLELLEKLRANKSTQRIGFILVTGTPSKEILDRGVALGLNNLVKKPFTTQTLKATIEAVVGRL
jgi:two-component system, chemotaxis family, chemotaxis protein CheY